MDNVLEKLYELTEKELNNLVAKGTLTPAELTAAKDAVCLMHKIRHFESDEEKYGWNEDGVSSRYYHDDRYYQGNKYPSYSMNNRPYNSYSGAKEHLIREAEKMMNAAVNDDERMAIMGYINRLNG